MLWKQFLGDLQKKFYKKHLRFGLKMRARNVLAQQRWHPRHLTNTPDIQILRRPGECASQSRAESLLHFEEVEIEKRQVQG